MKYYFVFEKSQEGIPTLIVYRDDGMFMFGSTPTVVNVFTGENAKQLFCKLTEKAMKVGDNNGEA